MTAIESIDGLKDDLWRRWRVQMERPVPARESQAGPRHLVYGRAPLYDLKTYTPSRFEPGGRSSAQPFSGYDNWIYSLDDAGRPVQMETRHSFNGIDWRAVYEYTSDAAEYVEWCLQTGVCSEYVRVTLRDALPAAFQRLMINAKGSFPVWRGVAKPKLIERIASDPKNYQITIERYDVRDGRVAGGEAYTEGLGAPPMRATLHYMYADGALDRIVQRSASQRDRTVYAAPRPIGLEQLAADLSRRIAERTIAALYGRAGEFPLAALELSYRSVQTYIPLIIPCTERDAISELNLCTTIDTSRWIQLPDEDFAPEITDFEERLRTTDQYEVGTLMLREAARQITERARHDLHVTPYFVAYAIDWELEGGELLAILRECGATPDGLRELQSRGWI